MAQGDEGARGARVERGAVRTGRCAAGLALLWFWVPWAAAIAHPLEQGALLAPLLATALFFGACACAALAALRLAKRVGTGYARMGDVLAASAGSLGSVIALLAYAAGEASLGHEVHHGKGRAARSLWPISRSSSRSVSRTKRPAGRPALTGASRRPRPGARPSQRAPPP